jgi:hypothetical protein
VKGLKQDSWLHQEMEQCWPLTKTPKLILGAALTGESACVVVRPTSAYATFLLHPIFFVMFDGQHVP